ncbi:hypothetical protein ACQVNO_12765 [Bacillus paranthracis]|uniref:hypothetical protein n=1 Tax=Bacillus paranthracis TaxID=2026186 RepID=UPI003D655757
MSIQAIVQTMRNGFIQTKDTDGNLVCGFKKEFLNFYISNMKNLHQVNFAQSQSTVELDAGPNVSNVQEESFVPNKDLEKGINKIVYGAPGTGKSYNLGKDCIRFTFHLEYTYFDFGGGIKPCKNIQENKISYEFVPGPILQVLKETLLNQGEMHTLVIEEINRANTANF